MFKLKRIEEGGENKFTVSAPEGYITIAGTSEFVVEIFKDLCRTSEAFLAFVRRNTEGVTHEDVAAEMRKAGFPENIVQDFENDNFWDDVIYE